MGCDLRAFQDDELPVVVQSCGFWRREMSNSFEVFARAAVVSVEKESWAQLDDGYASPLQNVKLECL